MAANIRASHYSLILLNVSFTISFYGFPYASQCLSAWSARIKLFALSYPRRFSALKNHSRWTDQGPRGLWPRCSQLAYYVVFIHRNVLVATILLLLKSIKCGLYVCELLGRILPFLFRISRLEDFVSLTCYIVRVAPDPPGVSKVRNRDSSCSLHVYMWRYGLIQRLISIPQVRHTSGYNGHSGNHLINALRKVHFVRDTFPGYLPHHQRPPGLR